MSMSFNQIKDTTQLQEYLQKHAATGNRIKQAGSSQTPQGSPGLVKPRASSPASNDYTTLKQLKATTGQANKAVTGVSKESLSTARSKASNRRYSQQQDEQRSIAAEQDYKKKDAVRHIVADAG